jgi:hypothetical protein
MVTAWRKSSLDRIKGLRSNEMEADEIALAKDIATVFNVEYDEHEQRFRDRRLDEDEEGTGLRVPDSIQYPEWSD